MPFVRQYQADAAVPGPFETRQARDMDTGETGRSFARLGDTISNVGEEIQKRDAQNEISDVAAKLSAAHADLTDQLTNTLNSSDGSDRELSDKFMQGFDDRTASIGDNVTTPEARRYFERANAQLRAHFTMKSMDGQAQLQGQKAVDDLTTEASNYSSSLMKDPDSFETVKNLSAASIQEKVDSGLIPSNKAGEYQAKLETQYAQSSLRGWITKGASQFALDQIKQGKWDEYLDGDQKFKMTKEAEQGVNAERIQADRQDKLEQQALANAQEKTQNAFLARMQPGADSPLTAQDILGSNLDPFGSGSKEQFIKMLKTASEEKLKTDPGVYNSLARRIYSQDGDPAKLNDDGPINEAFANGQLTHADHMGLLQEWQNKKTEAGEAESALKSNFLKSAEHQLVKANPSLGIADPDGETHFQRFLADFYKSYAAGRKSGKTPQQMLNPDSPDYLGKNMRLYMRTPQEIIESQLGSASSSNAPSSAATQSPLPSPSPSNSAGKGAGSGKTPPPGLNREQFLDWWKKNSG